MKQTTESRGNVNRRTFLGSSARATGATATAACLARITGLQNALAAGVTRQEPATDDAFEALASEYSLDPDISYLNHASIGTIPRPVQESLAGYLAVCESNPWLHMWGGAWDEPLARVRAAAAAWLHCQASEVAITHNTTEMFSTLANGLPWNESDEVLFSTLCHAGASVAFLEHAKRGRFRARRFPFPIDLLPGITSDQIVEAYAGQIRPDTRLLVLPHIDNTAGVRYPIRDICQMAREKGVEFVAVDAAQSVGMVPVNCSEAGIDLLATSGHKWLGGPKGTGLAYISPRIQEWLEPMWMTWGQQRWAGSVRKYEDYGTRNLPGVLALGDALVFGKRLAAPRREQRLKDLCSFTRQQVAASETLQWNSPEQWELSGSLYSIRVKKPADRLAAELFREHGIVVRPFSGSGWNNLRVSPNVFSSRTQIRQLLERIS